jgi:hypothetical protein
MVVKKRKYLRLPDFIGNPLFIIAAEIKTPDGREQALGPPSPQPELFQ